MRTEQRTIYITAGGQEFDNTRDCLRAEVLEQMDELFESSDIYWRDDVDYREVSTLILANLDRFLPLLQRYQELQNAPSA